ncbi:hypothetical protein ABZS88_39840 [Streptomyces sp. NPDC005480]
MASVWGALTDALGLSLSVLAGAVSVRRWPLHDTGAIDPTRSTP